MRAVQVKLKQEVTRKDALTIMNWMENHEVTRYLNEVSNISQEIKNMLERVNMEIMTHLFNRNGSFYVVCTDENHPVGFLKLVHKMNEAEIVVVIGDKDKWGHGLGTQAIREGLYQAFFIWRTKRVVAKIDHDNTRSMKAFEKTGFLHDKDLSHSKILSITQDAYIKQFV